MRQTMVYVSNRLGEGISMFRLAQDGTLDKLGEKRLGEPIMPLAVSPDRRFLYASLRGEQSKVATLAIEPDGDLDLLSKVPAPAPFSYITTDVSGRFLLGASYAGNVVCVFPVGKEGFVQADPVFMHHSSRNPHCVVVDPSNRFVFVPSLGSDCVLQYRFNANTGVLTANQPAMLPTRTTAGPRHLCVSPNRRFAYVVTELSGEVLCLDLDPISGALTEKQSLSLMPPGSAIKPGGYIPPMNAIPPGSEPMISAADIHITPDGKSLFASERSSSTLTCFAIDAFAGTMTRKGSIPTEETPRSFAICPRGRFLVVAGETSESISVYALKDDGDLPERVKRYPAGGAPSWVEMVEV